MNLVKVKKALISVSDKSGVLELSRFLVAGGVEIISTGGTYKYLKDNGVTVTEISEYTGFPEIMDGRVKTLHPKIHGGLLMRLDKPDHVAQASLNSIEKIGLVVVNLYPFAQTLKKPNVSEHEIIENIDIGGPSMLRSAAKNFDFTAVVSDPSIYPLLIKELETYNFSTSIEFRRQMAVETFKITAQYEQNISAWFAGNRSDSLQISATSHQALRYGENPHQKAVAFKFENADTGVLSAIQKQGKELSYNNILDLEAALEITSSFTEPNVVIIKHTNPCGLAVQKFVDEPLVEIYKRALEGDSLSAFGGIIGVNTPLDLQTANEINKTFFEAVICPSASQEALEILSAKKNLRVLVLPNFSLSSPVFRFIEGGILQQDRDLYSTKEADLSFVSGNRPNSELISDILVAFNFVKFVKSNAIVIVQNSALVSAGAGQTSRVDAVKIACNKAKNKGVNMASCVLASDAFFPFADNIEIAAEYGVKTIVAPAGSIRDSEVIEAAKKHGICLVLANTRHFKH